MEEVGGHHMTSPFLTTYIELWESKFSSNKQVWNYFTNQDLIDKIIQLGGLPILAHPTEKLEFYRKLNNFNAIEIYNAFFDYRFRTGEFKRSAGSAKFAVNPCWIQPPKRCPSMSFGNNQTLPEHSAQPAPYRPCDLQLQSFADLVNWSKCSKVFPMEEKSASGNEITPLANSAFGSPPASSGSV